MGWGKIKGGGEVEVEIEGESERGGEVKVESGEWDLPWRWQRRRDLAGRLVPMAAVVIKAWKLVR